MAVKFRFVDSSHHSHKGKFFACDTDTGRSCYVEQTFNANERNGQESATKK